MHDSSDIGWADRPRNQRLVRIVLYVACLGLLMAEFVIHRHAGNRIEALPLVYAIYGFAALILAVTAAKGLRMLLKRDEDFYD
ncbi:hypothetical protein [Luteimonas vadosa]|uniref:Uncharacterized protein n=1 Tax=Luteimonas vadosa TaxID=1165507 RepID=A0ABP9DVF0_9GAMM